MDHLTALRILNQETARVRRAMCVERALAVGQWAFIAGSLWLSASLFGLHRITPPLLGTVATIGAIITVALLSWQARTHYRTPTLVEARARLSAQAGFDATAASLLEDRPSQLDPVSLALWRRAQADAAARTTAIPARSSSQIAFNAADPWRLRFLLPAILIGAAAFAGPDFSDRLTRAALPDPGPLLGDRPLQLEAWATPADYTGAGPISLTDRLDETIVTGPSPIVTIRLRGPAAPPRLAIVTQAGRTELRFARAADGAFEAHAPIDAPAHLEVIRFFVKARWRIEPAPDAAPTAGFVTAPNVDHSKVVLSWRASDDFGVQRLLLRLTPIDPPPGLADAQGVDTPLDLPAGEPRSAEGRTAVDLTRHPFAGMNVKARIVAVDAAGREGASLETRLKLPEAVFLQPVARAAIEIRKIILHEQRAYAAESGSNILVDGLGRRVLRADDRLRRAPAAIRRAADMLDALTAAPEDGFFSDLAVYGGLRLARSILDVAREIEDTTPAADVLWNVAMRAEQAASLDARRTLDLAQSRLSDALRRGADGNQIAALSQTLAEATRDYLRKLAREAAENAEANAPPDDSAAAARSLDGSDLEQMLQDIEERAAAGDQAGAQQMLQAFANLLASIEVRLTDAEGAPGSSGDESRDLQQALDSLSQQIDAQRALRDDTVGSDGNGEAGASRAGELAERLGELAEQVRDAQRKVGDAGALDGAQALAEAGEAMDRAREAMQENDAIGAASNQDEALKGLRQASDALARRARGSSADQFGSDLDPLGRSMSGPGDATGAVPSEIERQRARDISDELRRRAQDATRPQSERDYLRRLLDRFTES